MAKAFRLLGYKVYDFEETITYCKQVLEKFYSPQFTKAEKIEFLRELLKDVDIVLDNPWYHFWEELMEAFPEAKCIFYERPLEPWYDSIKRQYLSIYPVFKRIPDFVRKTIFWFLSPSAYMMQKSRFKSQLHELLMLNPIEYYVNWRGQYWHELMPFDEIGIKRMYKRHNAAFLRYCPEDKRLILKDINCGWEVLCDFTGDDIPNAPWPHENKNCKVTERITAKENPFNQQVAGEVKSRIRNFVSLSMVSFGLYIGLKKVMKDDSNFLAAIEAATGRFVSK